VIPVTAVIAETRPTARPVRWDGPVRSGPSAVRTGRPAPDRTAAAVRPRTRTARSWPLLVLAAPAGAEVWSGWVGIAQMTGFGRVSPLPGIWPSLHLDTSITLPVGVEAYAAYALRAWLDTSPAVSDRTRRFARRSAIFSFALGMAGQVAYHLLAQAGAVRAPWVITMIVSCLPVLVLAMGTTLAHTCSALTLKPPGTARSADRPTISPRNRADQTRTATRAIAPARQPVPRTVPESRGDNAPVSRRQPKGPAGRTRMRTRPA
jgi:hypothetical protein